jgi:transposase
MAGTIFEKSTTSLRLWFYAMYLMGTTRCGISAKQIQRETGVTYKTAWRMLKQIRKLMGDDTPLTGNKIEMDETYIGGKAKNKRLGRRGGTGRSLDTKTPVFGMVERGGRVLAYVTPDVKAATVLGIVREKVLDKSTVFTDDYVIYDGLRWMGKSIKHNRINHSQRIYVVGQTHTNTIEGFWSLLKRGIVGVYHAVSAKYLQSIATNIRSVTTIAIVASRCLLVFWRRFRSGHSNGFLDEFVKVFTSERLFIVLA